MVENKNPFMYLMCIQWEINFFCVFGFIILLSDHPDADQSMEGHTPVS